MKNLIVIRHAKSSWDAPISDVNRPLENRGIIDAHLVAKHCIPFLPSKYILWCSTAKRAVDTATIFAQTLLYPVDQIVFKEELYTFDLGNLEKSIIGCSNKFNSAILFGHNEAITNFVNKFGDIVIDNVPTAGFVSLQFDVNDWKEIKNGKTVKTIFPKYLR